MSLNFDMGIEKIIGVALVTVVLSVLLKSYRPEISLSISLVSMGVMFALISPYMKTALNSFVNLSEQIGLNIKYMVIVIKVIGVAYITELGAEICRDSGENAVGTKVEICGKIIIIVMSMPVIYELFEVIGEIVSLV